MIINNKIYHVVNNEYPNSRGTKSKPDQENPCPFANLNPYFEI